MSLSYLTKLAQHVLPGDTHILQHEVPVVNVLKTHFGTDVSCSYAWSRRKHSCLLPLELLSPFCVRGSQRRRARSVLLLPQHG